jgi:uncharacterized membrane protein YdjX (TVP38/TMEM64 family)
MVGLAALVCPECGGAVPNVSPATPSVGEVLRRLGPTSLLAVGALVLPPIGSIVLFATMGTTGPWLKSHGLQGVAMYSLAFALLGGFALLPTYAQSALGGFAFGVAWGVPAALVGFVGGAVIGYEIARRASGDRVMKLLNEKPKWRAVRDALAGPIRTDGSPSGHPFLRTFGLVALLRLPPNSPFALTNLVMASVQVPRMPYVLGTLVGMAPRTAAAVIIGAGVKEFTKDTVTGAVPGWAIVVGILVMLVALGIVGMIANKVIAKVTSPG